MKKAACLFLITLLSCGIIWIFVFNLNNNPQFFETSISNIITIILTIVIAYYLTQLSNDERKKKEEFIGILNKIQQFVNSENALFNDKFDKRKVLLNLRSINNSIDLLKKYAYCSNIKKNIDYIKQQFDDYREFVGDNIEKPTYLAQSEAQLLKYLKAIDTKCDEIKLTMY